MKQVLNFIRNDSGATAIEYALIASLIAVAIITAVTTVGGKVSTVFTEVGSSLKVSKLRGTALLGLNRSCNLAAHQTVAHVQSGGQIQVNRRIFRSSS